MFNDINLNTFDDFVRPRELLKFTINSLIHNQNCICLHSTYCTTFDNCDKLYGKS